MPEKKAKGTHSASVDAAKALEIIGSQERLVSDARARNISEKTIDGWLKKKRRQVPAYFIHSYLLDFWDRAHDHKERGLPIDLASDSVQWGLEMVETINKLVRIHRELPTDWQAIKRIIEKVSESLPPEKPKRKPKSAQNPVTRSGAP